MGRSKNYLGVLDCIELQRFNTVFSDKTNFFALFRINMQKKILYFLQLLDVLLHPPAR